MFHKSNVITLIIFLIPIVIFLILIGLEIKRDYVKEVNEIVEIQDIEKKEIIHLSFVGDMMLDRGVKLRVNKYGGGDYNFLFEQASFLQEPDIMFGNLEGPVSARGQNVGSIYSFRFEPIVFEALKNAGFDVVSMANNHIGDWGKFALEDTLTLSKEYGIDVVGGGFGYEQARTPKIYEIKGIRIGYLAFSDFGPPSVLLNASSTKAGILSASDPNIATIISDASTQVDILVTSFHFGDEYKTLSNERQKRLARVAIDNGTDIVAGHHPHVSQEIELYKEGIIAYSLGNFIFDQNFSEETMRGLKFDVMVSKNGIESYSTSSVQLNEYYQPRLLP